jgi:hypothetical protein
MQILRGVQQLRGNMGMQLGNTARGLALAVATLGVIVPGTVRGAGSEGQQLAELRQELDQSLKMIAALTARVQQLEAALPASAATPAPAAPAQAQRLDTVESKVSQIEAANAARAGDSTSLPMHGFADVGVGNHNPTNADLKGFYVGNLDFYLTPRLGERTKALFELNFETDTEGNIGVDLERAQIGYTFSDAATVWLGRFHTPIGYMNTALHHGAWISNALRRPAFLNFEDHNGILPVHTVGTWLTGAARNDSGKFLYDAYIGNGQRITGGTIDMRNAGNDHGELIFGGRLGYQWSSGAADGLQLGVHAFSSKITDDQLPEHTTRVRVFGGFAVYDTDRWEHIGEIYVFDNEDLSGASGTHKSTAGFAQFAYRAPFGVPYMRYERASLQQSDQYFAQQIYGASYWRAAAGLRFDIDFKSALKIELANTHITDRSIREYNEGLAQYAIRF